MVNCGCLEIAAKRSRNGTRLVVINPFRPTLADHADYFRIKPGSDVTFYNALMNVILEEGLEDSAYIFGTY